MKARQIPSFVITKFIFHMPNFALHETNHFPHLPEIVETLPFFSTIFFTANPKPNLEKFLPFLPKILPHAKILLPLVQPQYRKIWHMLTQMEKYFPEIVSDLPKIVPYLLKYLKNVF